MAKIIMVWGLWGPYHCSRFAAFRDHAARNGHEAVGVSLFAGSRDNQWRADRLPKGVEHIELGPDETRLPWDRLGKLLAVPRVTKPDVALLPSYFHWSLALNVAVRLGGGRVVMMNETHAGTVRAKGWKAALKQRVVAGFHGGFVGGAPQVRYFASLGLPMEKIFTGYDAVDNDYFARRTAEIRKRASEFRRLYQLPRRYFLNVGRFVAKKNLPTLVRSYRMFLNQQPASDVHLVLVGSGEEAGGLRRLCAELDLPAYEKMDAGRGNNDSGHAPDLKPGVHFYGFRQIDENPVFYALAETFILPSLYEEWGLVMNEAMACGLPVIVSETAGCAEDLLAPVQASDGALVGASQTYPEGLLGKLRSNGFVFNPNSAEELSAVLGQLSADAEKREAMGRSSRLIVEKFSCENFARNALLAAQAAMTPDALPAREFAR